MQVESALCNLPNWEDFSFSTSDLDDVDTPSEQLSNLVVEEERGDSDEDEFDADLSANSVGSLEIPRPQPELEQLHAAFERKRAMEFGKQTNSTSCAPRAVHKSIHNTRVDVQPESDARVAVHSFEYHDSELRFQRPQHQVTAVHATSLLNHQRGIQQQLRSVQMQLQLLKQRLPASVSQSTMTTTTTTTTTATTTTNTTGTQTTTEISDLLVLRLVRIKEAMDQARRNYIYDHEIQNSHLSVPLALLGMAPCVQSQAVPEPTVMRHAETVVDQLEACLQQLLGTIEDFGRRQTWCLQQSVAKLQSVHQAQWQQATGQYIAELQRVRAKHKQQKGSKHDKLTLENQSLLQQLTKHQMRVQELDQQLQESRQSQQQSEQQLQTLAIRCEVAETEKRRVLESLEMRQKAMRDTVAQLDQSRQRLRKQQEEFAAQNQEICNRYETQLSQLQAQVRALEVRTSDFSATVAAPAPAPATTTPTRSRRSAASQTDAHQANEVVDNEMNQEDKAIVRHLQRRCAALERLLNKRLFHLAADQLEPDGQSETRRIASGQDSDEWEPEQEQSGHEEAEEDENTEGDQAFSWEIRSEDSFDAVKREFSTAQPSAKPPPSPLAMAIQRQLYRLKGH